MTRHGQIYQKTKNTRENPPKQTIKQKTKTATPHLSNIFPKCKFAFKSEEKVGLNSISERKSGAQQQVGEGQQCMLQKTFENLSSCETKTFWYIFNIYFQPEL